MTKWKLYRIDYKDLMTKRHTKAEITMLVMALLILIEAFVIFKIVSNKSEIQISEKERFIIISEFNKFTQDKFVQELKDNNLIYPWIPMAQSIQETTAKGKSYNSPLFHNNNNLFGMKEAASRPTTAKGTRDGHAFYDSWQESVTDYGYWQCRFSNLIHSEEQYYDILEQIGYAEDTAYIKLVKNIIETRHLRELFK